MARVMHPRRALCSISDKLPAASKAAGRCGRVDPALRIDGRRNTDAPAHLSTVTENSGWAGQFGSGMADSTLAHCHTLRERALRLYR